MQTTYETSDSLDQTDNVSEASFASTPSIQWESAPASIPGIQLWNWIEQQLPLSRHGVYELSSLRESVVDIFRSQGSITTNDVLARLSCELRTMLVPMAHSWLQSLELWICKQLIPMSFEFNSGIDQMLKSIYCDIATEWAHDVGQQIRNGSCTLNLQATIRNHLQWNFEQYAHDLHTWLKFRASGLRLLCGLAEAVVCEQSSDVSRCKIIDPLIGSSSNLDNLKQIVEELIVECDQTHEFVISNHLHILYAILSNYTKYPYDELYAIIARWSAEHGPCIVPNIKARLNTSELSMYMSTHSTAQAMAHIYIPNMSSVELFCSNPAMPRPPFNIYTRPETSSSTAFVNLHASLNNPMSPYQFRKHSSTRAIMILQTISRLFESGQLDVSKLTIPILRSAFFRVVIEDCIAHEHVGPTFHHHDQSIQPVVCVLRHVFEYVQKKIQADLVSTVPFRIPLNKTPHVFNKGIRSQLVHIFQHIETQYNAQFQSNNREVFYVSTRSDRLGNHSVRTHTRCGAGLHIHPSALPKLNTLLLRALRMARHAPHDFLGAWCLPTSNVAQKRSAVAIE